MEPAGRAVDFLNNFDQNQKDVIDKIKLEADRVDTVIQEFNLVKEKLDLSFADMDAKMQTLFDNTKDLLRTPRRA